MKRYTFFIDVDILKKIRKEVAAGGFDSVSSFIRKLIHDYFKNK